MGDLVGFNRGYTGHEHLDMFGIINMNGRVYDPATAMFFSPDPFVSSQGDWLNYNRYAYVLNNPMRYTDPSGYMPLNTNETEYEVFDGGSSHRFVFSDNHNGSISYNSETKRYEYANGKEAAKEDAMRQLYSNDEIDKNATLEQGYEYATTIGWRGTFDDFLSLYNQRTASSSYNGTFTVHTYESFFVPLGTGAKATGEINILLESGLVSNREILSIASTTAGALDMYGDGMEIGWKNLSNASKNNTVYQISQTLKNTGIKVNPSAIKAGLPKIVGRLGTGLAITSGVITTIDGLTNPNGWQNHHTADLIVNGTLYGLGVAFPIAGLVAGGVYLILDATSQHYTGKSLTENIFD